MADRVRKPEWLKINIGANDRYTETKRIVDSHCLHTICSSGLVDLVIEANPDIISHNMETVRRISPLVRSAANYDTSLQVIGHIARSGTKSKSGIMVGLGETPQEVETIMDDLLAVGCQILTIGQYLQPTHRHYPVAEYVTPQQFATYKTIGLKKGFSIVESAPLVRSSYHAEKHIR